MNFAYTFSQDGSICVLLGEESYTVAKTHINYNELRKAVINSDVEAFKLAMDIKKAIHTQSEGRVKLVGNDVTYNGRNINRILTQMMLQVMREEGGVSSMLKFLDRLMQNPSKNSVDNLCAFRENNHLPITEDGFFLAYKTVQNNYYDKYTGTIRNMVGDSPSMERNLISDDPNSACSYGLHAGGLSYSGPDGWYHESGDRIVIVKIDPADVVCVPHDHNRGKLRTCGYTVVGEYKGELNANVYKQNDSLEYRPIEESSYEEDNKLYDKVENLVDIWVGDVIDFNYHDKGRHMLVEEVDRQKHLVKGKTHDGFRTFRFEEMEDIYYAE